MPRDVAAGTDAEKRARVQLERLGRRFIRASLVYLSLGLLLGAVMLSFGNDNLQFVHGHMLLVGFALFLSYGLVLLLLTAAFHVPAEAVHLGWATAQFHLANVGLLGLLAGALMPVGLGLDRFAVLFGFVEAAAGVMFAAIAWKALRRAPDP
jgi:hypothetical protein